MECGILLEWDYSSNCWTTEEVIVENGPSKERNGAGGGEKRQAQRHRCVDKGQGGGCVMNFNVCFHNRGTESVHIMLCIILEVDVCALLSQTKKKKKKGNK